MVRNLAYTSLMLVLLLLIYVVFDLAGNPSTSETVVNGYETPLGLPEMDIPPNNPMTEDKISLGRKLFFDRRLSLNNGISCALCHVPEQGFTNNQLAVPVGFLGRSGRRNAPAMYNLGYMESYFQDGREPFLETQPIDPLTAAHEMSNPSIGDVIQKINGLNDYEGLFEQSFEGKPVSTDTLGMAFAAYLRSLTSANSAFDRWMYASEENAINKQAKNGYELFSGKAGCSSCHLIGEEYALFTDNQFHNVGIGYRNTQIKKAPTRKVLAAPGVYIDIKQSTIDALRTQHRPQDMGRYEVTQNPQDRWRYRTPTLRNVALTAPYMHDGSLKTLEKVVDYYDEGGHPHALQSPHIRQLTLTDKDKQELVEFLKSLTGDNVTELANEAREIEVGELTDKDPHWRHIKNNSSN